jgi:orotate phosphoribosyltransferase
MSPQDIIDRFRSVGAILRDTHVVYTSGLHGSAYVNKDALYPHTETVAELCGEIARRFYQEKVETVLAPALGGIVLTQWTAYALGKMNGYPVAAIFAEKNPDGSFAVRRGYDKYLRGRRTLVLEDVLTTGGSVLRVLEAVRELGPKVVGVGALCNRGGLTAEALGVPRLEALMTISLETYPPENCPLCARGVAIDESVGKGSGKRA